MPSGVDILTDPEEVIVVVTAQAAEEVEEGAEELLEGEEEMEGPEVISKGKEGEEDEAESE